MSEKTPEQKKDSIRENIITGVVVALSISIIYWAFDMNTHDAELKALESRVETQEDTTATLTQVQKATTDNLEGLSTDRAVGTLENSYKTLAKLEKAYAGAPPEEYSPADQDRYKAAQSGIESAKARLK